MSEQKTQSAQNLKAHSTKFNTYTVQSGDNLTKIAKQELGSDKWVDTIYQLNRRIIGPDPSRLLAGQELQLPIPIYEFDNINVWGHRWVNLLRALKTTLAIAKESIAFLDQDSQVEPAGSDFTAPSAPKQEPQETKKAPEQSIDDILSGGLNVTGESKVDENVKNDGRGGSEVKVEFPSFETGKSAERRSGTANPEANAPQLPDGFIETEKHQSQIVYALLQNLYRFVDVQFGRWLTWLTSYKWKPSGDHTRPPTDLLRGLFKNAAKDLEIFSKALQHRQRIPKQGAPSTSIVTLQSLTLFQADKLAASALAPLQPFLKEDGGVNIISYFSNNMHIRQIPYDDQVILIGIPYASVSFWNDRKAYDELVDYDPAILDQYKNRLPFDYMAIPHEIGHYIYHFAEMPHATIGQFFGPKHILPSKYSGWQEEIFADCVGCFIAGPLAVLGMQSLLAGTNAEEMFYDDGHHPIAAIRPFIMSQILRRLSDHYGFPEQFEHAPDQLDKNWGYHLSEIGVLSADASLEEHTFEFTLHVNHDDNLPAHHHNNRHAKYHAEDKPHDEYVLSKEGETVETTMGEIQTDVNAIIDAFIHLLLFKADMTQHNIWSKDLPAAHTPIEHYDDDLAELLHIQTPKLPAVQATQKKLVEPINQFEAEKQAQRTLLAWGDSGAGGFGAHP